MLQEIIAKSGGIQPLIELMSKASLETKEYATRTLWHLAGNSEVGVVMLSPDYPLLVDAENVSRSNDYYASCGFLRRMAHSHSRSCLAPVCKDWLDRFPCP